MEKANNNPFASASLYVGDLPSDVTEATLFELFNAIGPVTSIRVCRDATTRRSLGYAYINFHSIKDAERALDSINFTNIRGNECRIMWSQRDPRLRHSGKGNIFVKNLHESIDNKTLYDTFSVFGNILSCKVVVDFESQKSRGYGYVHYVDDKSATKAIEGVNGMIISDRKVHAELFKPRQERMQNYKYTNVYVKYIPKQWNEEILTKIFEECAGGKIDKLELWRHEYGISACLNFDSSAAAKTAVEKLNGKDVSSLFDFDEDEKTDAENAVVAKLYVARAQKRKERKLYLQKQKQKSRGSGGVRSSANLYVKNLSDEVDDTKLYDMFLNFGKITSAKVMCDTSGKSRNFGFVAFEKKEAASRAIHEMRNTLHQGKTLYVSKAQTKAFRQTFIRKQIQNKRIRKISNTNRPHGGGLYGGRGSQVHVPTQQFPGQMQMQMPYGMTNPLVIQQQQQFAAQQRAQQAVLMQQQQQLHAAQQMSFMQQQQQKLAAQQRSQTQVSQVSQPAQSIQSGGGQSTSIYAASASMPRPSGLTTSQQMIVSSSVVASQPHQSSVPTATGQYSVGQVSVGTGGQTSAPMLEVNPLTPEMLKDAKPAEKKRLIGERLFPKIQVVEPRLAGKITGMLLEMDNTELLVLLSEQKALMNKINEALSVLKDHQQKQSQQNPGSSKNPSSQNPGVGSAQN